jgi:phage terminase large subunit-like protein
VSAAAKQLGAIHESYAPPVGHLLRLPRSSYIHTHSRAQLVQRAEAMRARQVTKARGSASAFMEYCFVEESTGAAYQQQWFHNEWHEAWDKFMRVMVIAPRDHAKTSNVVGRTIWELGKNPNLRTKIVCASDGRAKERLFEIDQHILTNPRVHEVFPDLIPDPDAPWNAHRLVLKRTARHRDASVEALGITSTATGGRADLLIADDVVDRRNALSFPALREQIKQAWRSDWTNLLEPDSRVWYICTLWSPADLSHELMENRAYHVLRYDIDDAFGAIWPAKWSEAALRRRYEEIGSIEFNRAFRNQAIDTESAIIQPGWFEFSDLRTNDRFNEIVANETAIFLTSYDPAGTPNANKVKAKNQDYTGACIGAIDKERGDIYIVDAWHQRMSVKDLADIIYTEATTYEPWQALIEKTGLSTVDEWVLNEHPEMAALIKVTKPRMSKQMRLLGATPLLQKGKVIFSAHLDPNGDLFSGARGSLVDELIEFPFGKHDDMVDAFSQLAAAARTHFLDVDADDGDNVPEIHFDEEDDGYAF